MAILEKCNLDAYERTVRWFVSQEDLAFEQAVRRAREVLQESCSKEGKEVPQRQVQPVGSTSNG